MYQSKLIYLLRGLNPTEFKRFRKFLTSPIFNSNETPVKLYDAVQRYYPHFDSPRLAREKVYKKMFPEKEYHYHRMGNYMTEFTQLLESYLIFLEKEGDNYENKRTLTKALGKRNYFDLFEKGTMSLLKDLDKKPYRDVPFFREMSQIKSDFFFHPKTNRYTLKRDFPKEISDDLDKAFVLEKMQIANEMKSREKMLSAKYEINFLEEALDYAEKHFSDENPLFFIYQNVLSLHSNPDKETIFFELKTRFETNIERIRKEEQKDILGHLLNHSARQINKGKFEYNKETFSLYKTGLNHDLLTENNIMSETSFMNITGVASVLKEYPWAENFINTYADYLNTEIRQNIKVLCLSELKFRQKELDEALQVIDNQRFVKIPHEISSRSLMIKIWFEKFLENPELYEFLLAQTEAFEKFLRRNEVVSEKRTKGNLNFLKIIRKLAALNNQISPSKKSKTNLLKQINQTRPLIGKVWLTEKINELQ